MWDPLDLLRGGFLVKRVESSLSGLEDASDHSGEGTTGRNSRQPEGGLG